MRRRLRTTTTERERWRLALYDLGTWVGIVALCAVAIVVADKTVLAWLRQAGW